MNRASRVVTFSFPRCDGQSDKNSMHKKITSLALYTLLIASSFPAAAQQPKKVARIGYLSADDAGSESSRAEPIRLALRELGYMKDRISPSSTGMRRGSAIAFLSLPPNLSVSRLISC